MSALRTGVRIGWTSASHTLALALTVFGTGQDVRQKSSGNQLGRSCSIVERSFLPLKLDGRLVYVEPQAFAAARDRLLLAGSPSYIWRASPGVPALEARNSILGVVIEPDRRVSALASPIKSGPVDYIRALGRADGTWALVFAETAPPKDQSPNPPVVDYWFAVSDGKTWRQLTRLPRVQGTLDAFGASRIVEAKGTLAIAVPVWPSGATDRGLPSEDIVVFTERAGVWTATTLPTKRNGYVTLAASSAGDLALGVVSYDTTLSSDHNSLFLFERRRNDSVWHDRGRLIRGGAEPVHYPELALDRSGLAVTFLTRTDSSHSFSARVLLRADSASTQLITLANDLEAVRQVTARRRAWLSLTTGRTADSGGVLRAHQYVGDSLITRELSMPRFESLFATTSTRRAVYVTGPVRGRRREQVTVGSYLLTLDWRCDSIP
jgi:hypothetical protein